MREYILFYMFRKIQIFLYTYIYLPKAPHMKSTSKNKHIVKRYTDPDNIIPMITQTPNVHYNQNSVFKALLYSI